MNVSGPAPIAIVQRFDNTDAVLRMNQRIAAEVLQVSGDRVVLSVNGVQLVARLTSSDQAAQLLERRVAQFIVRDLSQSLVTLQLVPHGAESETTPTTLPPRLIETLLQQEGLPVNAQTVMIAKALLTSGLSVEAKLVEELYRALQHIGKWNEGDALAAALLKSAGLPVTSATVDLARQQLPSLGEMVQNLQKHLDSLLNGKPSPELAALAKEALNTLAAILLQGDTQAEVLLERLQRAIQSIGRSIERELTDLIRQLQDPDDRLSKGLLGIVLLRRELAKTNQHPALIAEIDRFLEGLRLLQFLNSEPNPTNTQGQWLRLNLPLAGLGFTLPHETPSNSRISQMELRIAYLPDESPPVIDAKQTRFIVRVALDNGSVAVDVSVAQRKIGVQVTASNQALLERAEHEFPSLKQGVEQLGYQVQSARCELGEPFQTSSMTTNLWTEKGEVEMGV
ncbi:MAG: hypothetical protein Kow0088_12130 [Anaerolineales bacterium]